MAPLPLPLRDEAEPVARARTRRGFARIGREHAVDFRHAAAAGSEGITTALFPPAAGSAGNGHGALPAAASVPQAAMPEADALRRRLLACLQTPLPLLLLATGPIGWPEPLFRYQREGVRILIASNSLLLADEMGLGKTIQVIAALRLLLRSGEIERSLVVVPANLAEQWRRALAHWAPELRVLILAGSQTERDFLWRGVPAHVTIVSYDTLRNDIHGALGERVWDVVALDEAQRIKNRDTDVARACNRLRRRRSWAITGTPLENRASDVASILDFVQYSDGAPGSRPRSSTPASLFDLKTRLGEIQLRRRKRDVLADLPPKIISNILLPLLPIQRRAYDKAEQEGILDLKSGGVIRIENVLTLIARLKQICNFAPEAGVSSVAGSSAKMDDLRGRIAELAANGDQALIFSQYVQAEIGGARRIAAELSPWNALVYAGDTPTETRERLLEAFQDNLHHTALVLSLRAGGQGLNLQNASYVFHFDRWWNPAVEQQAEDRAHRLGQNQTVHVYRYITEDTIEERIDLLLREKRNLFDQIVEGTTLDIDQILTKREIFGLLGLEL